MHVFQVKSCFFVEQQIFDLENQLREKTTVIENVNTQLANERKHAESYVERYRAVLNQLNVAEEKIAKYVGGFLFSLRFYNGLL